MKIKITKTSNRLDKKFTALAKIKDQWVEVGHFAEQGRHYSGYTFAELVALYHMGRIPGQPARRILDALFYLNDPMQSSVVKKIKKYWIQNLNTKEMLESIGMYLAKREKDLFGEVNMFMPPDKDETPLMEEGDLREATAYRTSMDKTVREV